MLIEKIAAPAGQFVVGIQKYDNRSSRIRGFKDIEDNRLPSPSPMLVLTNAAFLAYVKHGSMTDDVAAQVDAAFDKITSQNPGHDAYVGRAFYVPKIKEPNGPRTAGIKNRADFRQEVRNFWDYAIKHNYYTEGSDIALVFHPFYHALAERRIYGRELVPDGVRLPWTGGYAQAKVLPGGKIHVEIHATFGADESVSKCPCDTYLVDPNTESVVDREISNKNRTFIPVAGTSYVETKIPIQYQNRQALTGQECIDLAKLFQPTFLNRPDARIEFLMQDKGPIVREIAEDWHPTELWRLPDSQKITGNIITVGNEDDLQKITGEEAIVYFGPDAFNYRTTDLFAAATQRGILRGVALVYGDVYTAHLAKVLNEAGWSIMFVGDTICENGVRVAVYKNKEDKNPTIETLEKYQGAIIPLHDYHDLYGAAAGRKMETLALFRQYGFDVPDAFAIRSESIWQWLKDIQAYDVIARLDSAYDKGQIQQLSEEIIKLIHAESLPDALIKEILRAANAINSKSYIVRSSGPEDTRGRSNAGLYISTPDVNQDGLAEAIKNTVASYFSEKSIVGLKKSSIPLSQMTIGVGVQEYIPPGSGVIGVVVFTGENTITMTIAPETPSGIVQSTEQNYYSIQIDRKTNKIVSFQQHGAVASVITLNQLSEVMFPIIDHTVNIERIFQEWQDIELLFIPGRGIITLQSRPQQ